MKRLNAKNTKCWLRPCGGQEMASYGALNACQQDILWAPVTTAEGKGIRPKPVQRETPLKLYLPALTPFSDAFNRHSSRPQPSTCQISNNHSPSMSMKIKA
jgi:hypothetical protein